MGQYRNRCEIRITIVNIKLLYAHLNHLAEKSQVHVVKMIFVLRSSVLSDRSINLTSHSPSPLWTPSAKWVWNDLFNFHVFTIVTMRTPIIIKPCLKFLWTSNILFATSFAKYQINYIFKPTIQIFWPNLVCAFCSKWFKISSRYNMFANFTFRSFTRAVPTFFFNMTYFCPHKDIL